MENMDIQTLGFVFSYLVYFCGVFMGLELHKGSIDYNNASMQGHMEMCTPCFSITMSDILDDNTVCESAKKLIKYAKEQVYRLRLRFSMLGIEKIHVNGYQSLELNADSEEEEVDVYVNHGHLGIGITI